MGKMAKDEDGLTFSGPVDSERGRVHTPEAFQIPSWRSVHPSKEELSRISNPSFAGLAVLVVLVMFVGIGLAFIMDGRFLAGMILIVAGIVVSSVIFIRADSAECRRLSAPSMWDFQARGVAFGAGLAILGLVLLIFLSESLIFTAIGICALAWGLFTLMASLRE